MGSNDLDEIKASGSADVPAHKCCLGMLYYSQTIHGKGWNPVLCAHNPRSETSSVCDLGQSSEQCLQVCGGIRSKQLTSSDLAEVPPESIPNGEFKVCLPARIEPLILLYSSQRCVVCLY